MAHQEPWGHTSIRMSPTGLRECVLRIQFLGPKGAELFANQRSTALLNRVARWRLTQPQKWNALVEAMGTNVAAPRRKEN